MKALLGTALTIAIAAVAPAMAQNAPTRLAAPDQHFLKQASHGNVAEVKLAKLALEKTANPQVKQFAQRMIDDHNQAEDQLKQALNGSDLAVPDHPDRKSAALYNRLSRETGPRFDRAYMHAMVDDHRHDIDAFKREANRGKNGPGADYARNTLPTLQQHLSMAEQVDQQVSQSEGR